MKGGNSDMTARAWRPEQPYDRLPRLVGGAPLESVNVLRACVGARAAVAELSMACRLIPAPSVLIGTLPLLEAQASSEIENVVTTLDDLFQHAGSDASAPPAVREALRYRRALVEGAGGLASHGVSTRTAEVVCSRIKGAEMSVRKVPGTRLVHEQTGTTIYTPPEGEGRLRELLSDWERFLHEPAPPDPLIRLAASHYQFEAIHPFGDGNGRTGRVLMSLSLVDWGLLPMPVLYLSRHILRSRSDYYRLLLDVTRSGAWEPWLLYMLAGFEETARWTTTRIHAIQRLQQAAAEHARKRAPRVYSRELVDLLFAHPYARIEHVVGAGLGTRQTAAKYLRELVRIGVLTERKAGRARLFVNHRLMQLLTRESPEGVGFE